MVKKTQNDNKPDANRAYEATFVVEIRQPGSEWGRTPKVFDSKVEAENEAKRLKKQYPFLDECRVVRQKVEDKSDKY